MLPGLYCDNTFRGGKWLLVRRVAPGGTWHPSTFVSCKAMNPTYSRRDNLAGTDVYGVYSQSPSIYESASTFSVHFADQVRPTAEFLFVTGDSVRWLHATYNETVGQYYTLSPRTAIASSTSSVPCKFLFTFSHRLAHSCRHSLLVK
jgi:hypothetical protein